VRRDTRSGTKGGRRCWAPPFHPQYVLPIDCVSWNHVVRSCSRYDRDNVFWCCRSARKMLTLVSVLIMYLPALMKLIPTRSETLPFLMATRRCRMGRRRTGVVPNIARHVTSRHQCLCRLVLYQFPQGLFLSHNISPEIKVLTFCSGSNQFRCLLFVGEAPETLDRCARRHARVLAVETWGCWCVSAAGVYFLCRDH